MDFFSLDSVIHFDCSDLQLFAFFMAKKLVGPQCVQMVSSTLQRPYDFHHHTSWYCFLWKILLSSASSEAITSYGHVLQ